MSEKELKDVQSASGAHEGIEELEQEAQEAEVQGVEGDRSSEVEDEGPVDQPTKESKVDGKSKCQEEVSKEDITQQPSADQETKEEEVSCSQEAQIKTPSELEVKTFSFDVVEVKQIERDGMKLGVVAGYGSTFHNVDRGQDRVMPGAFKETIKRHQDSKRPVRMYYQHNSQEIIGGFPAMQLREDSKGLFIVGEVNLEVQRGREVFALAKQGVLTDFSIGYSIRDFDLKDGVRELKEIELWEVSVVSEPMNPEATITEVKQSLKTKRDVERNLRDSGLSRSHAALIASLVDEKKLHNDSVVNNTDEVSLTEQPEEAIEESSVDDSAYKKTQDLLRQATELLSTLKD